MTATAHPTARVRELANFVNGEHVPPASGRAGDVVDPSTGKLYARAPVSSPADLDAGLRAAAAAQEGWTAPPPRGCWRALAYITTWRPRSQSRPGAPRWAGSACPTPTTAR